MMRFNRYVTYVFSEMTSKAIIVFVTIVSASIMTPVDYANLGVYLAWIGIATPLFLLSSDVAIIRYMKREDCNTEYKNSLIQAHQNIALLFLLFGGLLILALKFILLNFQISHFALTLVFSCAASIVLLHVRLLLFDNQYLRASMPEAVSSAVLIAVFAIALIHGSTVWHLRITAPLSVYAVLIITFNWINISKLSSARPVHYHHIFDVAKWTTTQMLLSSFYIYGDRLISSLYLDSVDFSLGFLAAQCAFLLSFFNRVINTYWQINLFNNSGEESQPVSRFFVFALCAYTVMIFFPFQYFKVMFPDSAPQLMVAYAIYSIGFFMQNYYHFSNSALLWRERYDFQMYNAICTSMLSILCGFILYNHLPWYFFGSVFCMATLFQFILVNIFLWISGSNLGMLLMRSFVFCSFLVVYASIVFVVFSLYSESLS